MSNPKPGQDEGKIYHKYIQFQNRIYKIQTPWSEHDTGHITLNLDAELATARLQGKAEGLEEAAFIVARDLAENSFETVAAIRAAKDQGEINE